MVKKLLKLKTWYFIFTLLFLGTFSTYADTAAKTNSSFSLLKTKAVVAVGNNISYTYGETITFSDKLSFVNYLWADTPTAEAGFKEVFQKLEVVILKGEGGDNKKNESLKVAVALVITCPIDITIECGDSTDPLNTGTATATDACGTIISYKDSFTQTNNGTCTDNSYVITRTWIAKENCGNTIDSCEQIINVASPAVTVTSPANSSASACTFADQAAVDSAFATWLTGFTVSGGCSATGSYGTPVAPVLCTGGTTSVTYTVNDLCNPSTVTKTFTVLAPPAVTVTSPANSSASACTYADQAAVNTAFNTWLTGFTVSGGCSPLGSYGTLTAPVLCTGGTTSVTYTVTDKCYTTSTVTRTFTVTAPPAVAVNSPVNASASACTFADQAAVDSAFNTWLTGFTVSGGCSATGSYGTPVAPVLCTGGTTSVTYTVNDLCNPSTVTKTFTVLAPPAVTVTSPANSSASACTYADQAAVDSAFATWLTGFTVSGGCSATGSYGTPVAPVLCTGGTTSVTYTVNDLCNPSTVTKTFTVVAPTDPSFATIASDLTVQCGSGNASSLTAWLSSNGGATANNGCRSVTWSNNFTTLSDLCGSTGAATVTFRATDDCGKYIETSATFTIIDTTAPVITGTITPTTVEACGIVSAPAAQTTVAGLIALAGNITITDACTADANITVSHSDVVSGSCPIVITRTYTVRDQCNNASSFVHIINIADTTPPTADNLPVITVHSATIPSYNVEDVTGEVDNCGTTPTVTHLGDFSNKNTCLETITRKYKVTDLCGIFTVKEQLFYRKAVIKPIPKCRSNVVVTLSSETGIATISPTDINNGSTANCLIASITVSPSTFGCADIGNQLVTLTVTDIYGNSDTCTSTVIVNAPTINSGILLGYSSVQTIADAKSVVDLSTCPYDTSTNPATPAVGKAYVNLTIPIEFKDNILEWQTSIDGGINWVSIGNNTTYKFFDNITKTTLVRVVIQVENCVRYSSTLALRIIPPTDSPILTSDSLFDVTNCNIGVDVTTESIYGTGTYVNNGGAFEISNPKGYRVDYLGSGQDNFPGSASSGKINNFAIATTKGGKPPGRSFSGQIYNGDNLQDEYAVVNGNICLPFPEGTGRSFSTLETPVFSLANLESATLSFNQAFKLVEGSYIKVQLSLNGGDSYGIDLDPGLNPITGMPFNYIGISTSGADTHQGSFVPTSISLNDYKGMPNLRVRFYYESGCKTDSSWAIDDITIPEIPLKETVQWTDEFGNIISTNYSTTITPITPGKIKYGATTLVDQCRAPGDEGTVFVNINYSLVYAGENIAPKTGECGYNTVQLKAYDNFKSAQQNYINGVYKAGLYKVPNISPATPDYDGTKEIGTWSVILPLPTSTCIIANPTFSDENSPNSTFTADISGTYTLKWTINGCDSFVNVEINNNCDNVNFDGINDYVSFKNNYNFSSTNEFSFEVWVKPNSVDGLRTILSKRNGNDILGNGYDLRITDGIVSFNFNENSITSGLNKITNDRWYHIALTFDGSIYNLYIDGILINTSNGIKPITNDSIEFLLGAMDQTGTAPNNPVNYFFGWMDELKVWSKALDVHHIRQMMNQEIKLFGSGDVGGLVIPTKIYGPANSAGSETNKLFWSNLMGYYRMSVDPCTGYLIAYKGIEGKLRNIIEPQEQTAPIPYESVKDGDWTNRTLGVTPWKWGATVWDYPNSIGVNGAPIDWNIVVTQDNINSSAKDITLLGLLVENRLSQPIKELTISNPGGVQDETNSGQMLWITHYLKLDGIIDLVGESQLVQKRYGFYIDHDNNPLTEDIFYSSQVNESIFEETSSGYIERDQQGTSNLYNYNYWSSPVGAQNTTANNMPFTLLNNKFDGTTASAPQQINWMASGYNASPSSLSNPISIPEYWLWSYENFVSNTYSKWVKLYKNTQIKVGLGYSMKGSGSAKSYQNYTFIGKPNNNTVTTHITIGNDALIGNPYPSAIDAREFIKDNIPLIKPDGNPSAANLGTTGSIDGSLYFWIHYTSNSTHILRDYQGGYATYNISGGAPPASSKLTTTDGYEISGAGSSNLIPGNYIPVAQGFFVHSADTYKSSDQIKFQNNQRVFRRETIDNSSDGSQFLKSGNSKNKKSSSNPIIDETAIKRVRLQIKTPDGTRRHLLLAFTPDNSASDGFDYGYDARVFETLSNDILFMIDNEKFVIQGVGAFDETKKYPLGIFLTTKGYVKIAVSALENMDENITVHIKDKFTGKTHNITHHPFEIELDSGEYLDRFDLVFKMIKLVAEDLGTDILVVEPVIEDPNYHVFMNNTIAELQIKNNGTDDIRSITLFNVLGQTMMTWNKELNRRIISLPVKLATGVYMVQINAINGTINKRIIIE